MHIKTGKVKKKKIYYLKKRSGTLNIIYMYNPQSGAWVSHSSTRSRQGITAGYNIIRFVYSSLVKSHLLKIKIFEIFVKSNRIRYVIVIKLALYTQLLHSTFFCKWKFNKHSIKCKFLFLNWYLFIYSDFKSARPTVRC